MTRMARRIARRAILIFSQRWWATGTLAADHGFRDRHDVACGIALR